MSTDVLRLWQLISPALPVGAFHYSQGLEQAVQRGWVADADHAYDWIRGVLVNVVTWVDLPLVKRAYEAWRGSDEADLDRWNGISTACRETAELRAEEQQMGAALTRLAGSMEEPLPRQPLGFTAAFAVVAANNNIPLQDAMMGFAWAWCENQTLAAVKLVPLGHHMGQSILRRLGGELGEMVALADACTDAQIGRTAPGFAMASGAHETQYSRLFRS